MKIKSALAPTTDNSLFRTARNLSPSWFAAVMGTGIFSIASKYYACYWNALSNIAVLLWVVNIILFIWIATFWFMRWFLFKDYALKDLKHPITGQFYATMPIGCLVLAADFILFGPDYLGPYLTLIFVKGLWIIGMVLALLSAVVIPVLNYFNKITIEDINPAWLMPPVSLILVPIAGAALIPYWSPSFQKILLIMNYVFWGSGFFLFIFMAVICFYRFFIAPPLPSSLIPTIWIYLGPIGAGTISLLKLGAVSPPYLGDLVMPILNLIGLIYWSFGVWWLLVASLITIIYLLKKDLPYALSWWAYTFPLGAYTVATFLIATSLGSELTRLFGFLCYWLLVLCWFSVFSTTFIRVVNGTLFKD